jgi:hypothetical protein
MRRAVLALVVLAGVATVASPGTYSAFTVTRANTTPVTTQATFPPLNSAVPTVSSVTVLGVTTLTGHLGSWAITNAATTTYTLQWQRCTAGACSDVGAASVVSSLLGTLDHIVIGADAGSTLRLKVTATDSAIVAPDRGSTIAYSAEVPA